MSRTVGGILGVLGLIAALIATWNIHFAEAPVGQIIIGALGLGLAFFFSITIQENPRIQRASVFGLMVADSVMIAPLVWKLFVGNPVTGLQVVTAVVGAILLFINWRMLPR
jgi:hypothetical protein